MTDRDDDRAKQADEANPKRVRDKQREEIEGRERKHGDFGPSGLAIDDAFDSGALEPDPPDDR